MPARPTGEGKRSQQQRQRAVATPVSNDQSWPEISGQRASQRALATEYIVQDSSAPTAHNSPSVRRHGSPLTCEPANGLVAHQQHPARHSSSEGASRDSATAPASRLPASDTSTGTMPTISEAAAPPLHCTAIASSTK
jgi:hypothetical protein